jgi:uncharacterized Zn finger protein
MTERCTFCGGGTQQSTRIDQVGEHQNAVAYPRHAVTCTQCGRVERDEALRDANHAVAVIAKSLSLGIET